MTALHERSAPDAVIGLLTSTEAEVFYDEVVTEREHAEQCAAWAADEGAPPHLVVAALCHDLGHILLRDNRPIDVDLERDARHERAAARFLARWYGPAVTEPIGLHVAAKRYLCSVDPDYRSRLSPSSERSLIVQGGLMTDAEAVAFEANPHFEPALAVRRWDDLGKVEGREVPPVESYRSLLDDLTRTHGRQG